MREVCIVPTYRREELLFACLRRIRLCEPTMEVYVFPDRGTLPAVREIVAQFSAIAHDIPDNPWYGGTPNTMNALRWAYDAGFSRVFYIEDDVFVHPDFFSWHRSIHNEFPGIFASSGWIFNRYAPIQDGLSIAPWMIPIGCCFERSKLRLIVNHAIPAYYSDLPGYLKRTFDNAKFDTGVEHYEYDGLMQRVLERDKNVVVSPRIGRCSHMGFTRSYGHNDVRLHYEEILGDVPFEQRVENLERFANDLEWRSSKFGKEIVDREIGHTL